MFTVTKQPISLFNYNPISIAYQLASQVLKNMYGGKFRSGKNSKFLQNAYSIILYPPTISMQNQFQPYSYMQLIHQYFTLQLVQISPFANSLLSIFFHIRQLLCDSTISYYMHASLIYSFCDASTFNSFIHFITFVRAP